MRYNFQTQTSGSKFDCSAPVNNSPHNTGEKALPPAQPAWISYSYGSGQYPELGVVGGRTAVMGAVYRWQPGGSINKLPRHYDGSKFLMEYSRGWINEARTDADGKVTSLEAFLPAQKWTELISMRISPNGVMYVAQYGSDSTVYRVNYVGNNNQPPVAGRDVQRRLGADAAERHVCERGLDGSGGQAAHVRLGFRRQRLGRLDRRESVARLRGRRRLQREAHGQRRPGHEPYRFGQRAHRGRQHAAGRDRNVAAGRRVHRSGPKIRLHAEA